MADPKHLVRTRELRDADFTLIRHPLNAQSELRVHRLGDHVGMQRAHLSLARLPPGKESFLPHAHATQEEFLFILEGRGMALLGDSEVEVGPGDHMGFPTDGTVHHLRNVGEADLVYLMGGERTDVEVSRFPSIGRVGVFRTGEVSFFDENSSTVLPRSAWRPKE
jgi:uncharacterized cupin superfamily protein